MASWFDRAYQRVSSLSSGPVSLGRRLSSRPVPSEVANFKQIVSDLMKEEIPDKCIDFFLDNISSRTDKEIGEYGINGELSRIIRHIQSHLDHFLGDDQRLEKMFSFLNCSMRVYISSAKNDSSVFRILIKIFQTNSTKVIESASSFIQQCFTTNDLVEFIFKGQQLSTLWSNFFAGEHDAACACCSSMVNSAATNCEIKDFNSIQNFIDVVTIDLNENKVETQFFSSALYFVGCIVKNVNSGDFLPNIFPIISEMAPLIDDLIFFEPMIAAQTSDQPAVWAALDAICFNPDLSIELLESALSAINNSQIPPDPEVFSFNSFVPRIVQLSDRHQQMIFDVLKKSRIETKADFMCWVMPLSQTGVCTSNLLDLIEDEKFDQHIEDILLKFLIEPEIDEVQLCLDSDEHFFKISLMLMDQITSSSANTQALFERFTSLVMNNDQAAIPLLTSLLIHVDPSIYIEELFEVFRRGEGTDKMINIFIEVSKKVFSFNDTFLKMNGVELIPIICDSATAGLNFLASLVVDGPYKIIDDYIFDHFKETALASYDNDVLINLMMGMPQNSSNHGFLRIPSLCAFVEDVPLRTPYDQYIFSSLATSYFEPTKEQILKFANRYMNRELALTICRDPEYLPSITDPLYPHCTLYQMHPMARNCSVGYQRTLCCSFWFNISEIYGKTVLASFPGGSLDIESNGYITFGNRSLYCTLKNWHLFSFMTNDRNNQKVITGYLDAKKVSDVLTNHISTITIGHDDSIYCNALWFISPFLHSSNTPLDENDLQKIYELGHNSPTQKLMHSSKGARLVPYRGILRYMHLFGGPYYIFNSMLEFSKTKEEFLFYMQSAFNLLNLKAFQKEYFYASIHYILRRKIELFTPQTEQVILHELANSKNDTFDWNSLLSIMGDIVLLSSPYVSCHFLKNVFKVYNVSEESIPFFHLLIDAFVFIKCDEKTTTNILDIIRIFIKFKQELIRKITLTIVSIPFCDTDNVEVTFTDKRFTDKQIMLINILKEDKEMYVRNFNCGVSFLFSIKLNDELCIDFLEFIAQICTEKKDYFDMSHFKKITLHLHFLVQNEKLWNVLFMFLMNKKAEIIEDYLAYEINRPNIFSTMFDLLTSLIPFDMKTGGNNHISFRVLHTMYSLVMTQSLKMFNMIESIQNLCSLGYGERTPYPYPFQLSKKVPVSRRASRPRVYRTSFDTNENSNPFGIDKLIDLDPILYDAMQAHMVKHQVSLEQFGDIEIPEVEDPTNFDEVLENNSNVVDFVALLASKCLVEIGNDPSTFKKALGPLMIYGADVLPKVAIAMHRKVVNAVLDDRQRISNDSMFFLIEFLTNKVVEGWWNGAIIDLYSKLILNVNATHRSIPTFIIACFLQTKNPNELKAMATLLLNSPLIFTFCIESAQQQFFNSFLYIVTTQEMQAIHEYNSFIGLLVSKIPKNHDLCTMIQQNKSNINVYREKNIAQLTTTFTEYSNQIESTATTNSAITMAERIDITRKTKNPRLFRFERSNITHITFLRRAFRYEFFLRVNRWITVLEPAITNIFHSSNILEKCAKLPEQFSVAPCSHPLTVPMKQIPLVFPYESKYEKVDHMFSVPCSKFSNDVAAVASELNAIHYAPKCLEGWSLPGHYYAGITSLFKQIFHGVNDPFKISLLSSPDPLQCVGIMSSDTLHILMNATIDKDSVITLIEKPLVSHYPLFENAIQGLMGECCLFNGHVVLMIPFSFVTIVIPRSYCYEQTAVDLFTANGCHFTLVCDENSRKMILSKMKTVNSLATRRGPGFSQRLLNKSLDVVSKFWGSGLMSNFDYLLYLNSMSGRSFNDFSQYPVFPWIISDYTSNEEPTHFRDLGKPMGQQTEERALKYEETFHESDPHYFYGTHYSYPGAVLYFLVRSEPKTLFNYTLHGGFDHPDRVFLSFDETWKNASELNSADVKELVPEFYCFAGMLQNVNKYSYPHRSDGTPIDKVILPKWAKDDPFVFVYKMRRALESRSVTEMLPMWIDLIFGFKQRGEPAIESKNVFTPLSYDNTRRDKESAVAENVAIANFGQCPSQLFLYPHLCQSKIQTKYSIGPDPKITLLKKTSPNMQNVRIHEDEVFFSAVFSHFIGNPLKELSIEDGVLSLQGHCQYVEPVFDITASSISSDAFYLTIVNGCGMVLNYWFCEETNLFIIISRSLIPGVLFKSCAISSQFSVVVAASDNCVYLFDMTSGFLMREIKTNEYVRFIKFNEINDFIILCESNLIHVVTLDFQEICSLKLEDHDEITSLSTCDSVIWLETPVFATGHKNGNVIIWSIQMVHKTINVLCQTKIFDSSPIVALEMLQNYRAIVCATDEGDAAVISSLDIQRRVLKTSCFENCSLCGQTLIGATTTAITCSVCGLPYCKQCAVKEGNNAHICQGCSSTEKIHIPSKLFRTSMSSFKSNESLPIKS